MTTREQALAFKATGNAFFSAGKFAEAIPEFTKAIELDPTDHVFYSNRSACHASLGQYNEALQDADKCVNANPTWAKGYVRKGLALFNLNQLDAAKAAYEKGLTLDANNASLKEGLQAVEQKSMQQSNPLGQLFGPGMWVKLQQDPTTREMLKDQSFVAKLNQLQANPNLMSSFIQDPQMSKALGVLLGIPNMGDMGGAAEGGEDDAAMDTSNPYGSVPTPEAKTPAAAAETTPAPTAARELTAEEKEEQAEREAIKAEKAATRREADEHKNRGNTHYKKKEFTEAIAAYKQAFEVDPTNPAYLTNEAAVRMAQADYQACVDLCAESIKVGKAQSVPYETLAKAYLRQGNAYARMKDYEKAIEAYNNSIFEYRTTAAAQALRRVETLKKKLDAEAYLSPELSNEAKLRGNTLFQEGKWKEAIDEYSEALKRDPSNYKVYSNRAGCYTKLMAWPQALSDCEKCLEIDPTFVKAYIRKAKVHHVLREYHKAIRTYDQGLSLDPNSSELREGKFATEQRVREENSTGEVDPKRREAAMRDPEIQAILRDPSVNAALQQMQTDPQAALKLMQDPTLKGKVDILLQAGVLQMR